MPTSEPTSTNKLPKLVHRGKVRDSHELTDRKLLMVCTDRVSAYDVVLPNPIPGKGIVLNQLSAFWFNITTHIVPNHFVSLALDDPKSNLSAEIKRRSMVVNKAKRIDIECVARGYITGSALQEYKSTGKIAGTPMPKGLIEGDRFPEPIFTPATKSSEGHDENITIDMMASMIGADLTEELRDITLKVYSYAHEYALKRNIIIADTKMEFGMIEGTITLIDELLTPDSSRFWDNRSRILAKGYKTAPVNFDKQYVRDWLLSQGWNREPPAPMIPEDIVRRTQKRYHEAFRRITNTDIR